MPATKREPLKEAETQGGGWEVVQESLMKFSEVKKLNEFEALCMTKIQLKLPQECFVVM